MRHQKLLVLDLDEALVFADRRALARPAEAHVGPYFVYRRPGATEFVDWCVESFSAVAIWTASTLDYALPVIDTLLGGAARLEFVWGRERCTWTRDPDTFERSWIKDIKKLRRAGYPARSIIAVDNTPSKWRRSYGNLVRVSDFEGDEFDTELADLRVYLDRLGTEANIRTIEKRLWRRRLEASRCRP